MSNYEALIDLVQPIIDRTEGQIGTHSDRCYEYHVGCLAVLVKARLNQSTVLAQHAAMRSAIYEVLATGEVLGPNGLILSQSLDAGIPRPDWLKDTQPEQGGIPGLTEAEATAYTEALHDPEPGTVLRGPVGYGYIAVKARKSSGSSYVAPPVEGVREALAETLHSVWLPARLWPYITALSREKYFDAADALLTEFIITPKETP